MLGRFIGPAAIIVGLFGCATSGSMRLGASAPPKPPGCPLDIYSSEAEVRRPFEMLCLLDAKTGTHLLADRSIEAAVVQVRAEACKCGADAIVVTGVEKEGVTLWSWGHGRASAKGIRYRP
jgi:hypothetical protein